ncbi:MAG: hypothetical protein ABW318_15200 [Vicinamibacterales bacterium]
MPGLNALFGLEYAKYAEEHKQIFKTESSDKAYEEEVKLSGFGAAPVKPEAESIQFDEAGELYTSRYTHETIALGFAITEEAFEDNLYDSLSNRYTRALARSMAHTKQVKAAAVLNRAFDTLYKGGDGQPLISATHPLSVGVISNISDKDLSEAALEEAIGKIGQWTDDRGLLIAAQARKLIVPPGPSSFEAARILQSEYRPGTADNDINVISTNGLIPEGWVTNHYLTDPDSWFLTTDIPNGLKHFQRVPIKNTSEGDFDTGNMRYKSRERYSFGWSDPLAIFGSPGAP